MVSLNEDDQPHNQSKFKSVEVAIERSIHDEFEEILMLVRGRNEALAAFKKDLSLDFLAVEKMLAGIKQKIKDFSSVEDPRFKNSPVLTKGHKFFFDLMKVESDKIIEALDQEMRKLTERIKAIEIDKQSKIDAVLMSQRSTMQQISQETGSLSLVSSEENLKAAIKTMRKLPIFGKYFQDRVDCQWPNEKDLLAMPKDKPITLSAMSFKKSEHLQDCLSVLQMHYSNGVDSPKFLCRNQSGEGLERINIPQDKKAKTISCRVAGDNECIIYEVAMLDKDGTDILNYKACDEGNYFSEQLEEGEEIIGCYGVKNQSSFFDSIGFIVWRPPKTN